MPSDIKLPSFPVRVHLRGDNAPHSLDLAFAASVHQDSKTGEYAALIEAHPTTLLLIDPEFYEGLVPYLQANYHNLGGIWINPIGVVQMRLYAGKLSLQFISSNLEFSHGGTSQQIAAMARRSGLTPIGNDTYASLSHAHRYHPASFTGFIETGWKQTMHFRATKNENDAIVAVLEASGWLHLDTGDWANPDQIQIRTEDGVGYTHDFAHYLTQISADDLQRVLDIPDWFETQKGLFLRLSHVSEVGPKPGKTGANPAPGRVKLGNGYELNLPYDKILLLIHHFTTGDQKK